MNLTRENIIQVLQKDFDIKNIALFGSYAKNNQNETSDIDFLVEQNEIDYASLYKTLVFIEKKFPGKPIQIIRKGPHLSQKFLNNIAKDLVYV
jgi:hypothetical protein